MKLEFKKSWVTDELTQVDIESISKYSRYLALDEDGKPEKDEVSTSQLRKFYGEVKRIQANTIQNEKSSFKMLKPKLAYAVGREKKKRRNHKLGNLYEVLAKAIDSVDIDSISESKDLNKRFSNFVHLFEAIVAYHKYHGGKD